MPDFDDMMTDAAPDFMAAFSTVTTGTYYPVGRPKIENITVMYDKKVFEPDALGENLREAAPRITIETAALTEKPKMEDRIEFTTVIDGTETDVKVKVEQYEGDEMGLTSLRVRVIN